MSYHTNNSSPTNVKVIDIGNENTKTIQCLSTFQKADIVFIIATMGDETTTKRATTLAKSAKKQNKLTVGITKLPFTFEGRKKKRIAHHGMMQMKTTVDFLIAIPNDQLLKEEYVNAKIVKFIKEMQEFRRDQLQQLSHACNDDGPIVLTIADIETLHINFIYEQYNHKAFVSS